ncbi:MAG TPA: site-2 protease family protein [Candidatus Binataceae bacterium]|nr:site-2 protease family protein [Candidatus Binataceae bacterium]
MENIAGYVQTISIFAVPILFAIIAHEVMHGVVALRLGDDTALRAGRLTLNPISHIDLFGTILMPAMLLFFHLPVFGYAKPVPVDFSRLRGGRTGMIKVAAAGPLTNLALAIVSALGIRAMERFASGGALNSEVVQPLASMMVASVYINVGLGVFNLFPLLPLDGGRVLVGMLPLPAARAFARTEPYGFLILLVLLYTNSVEAVISPVIQTVTHLLL